jgi:hypothetical protein
MGVKNLSWGFNFRLNPLSKFLPSLWILGRALEEVRVRFLGMGERRKKGARVNLRNERIRAKNFYPSLFIPTGPSHSGSVGMGRLNQKSTRTVRF